MTDALTIHPVGRFQAELRPPGSKSLTNRALLLAALAEGDSHLSHVLLADDTWVMLQALRDLGFKLEVDEAACTVDVQGSGGRIPGEGAPGAELFLGNAGTAMRFLTAACCLGEGSYVLDGVARMRQRPIAQLVEPLRRLGAEIEYIEVEGYPPLRVHGSGGLEGGVLEIGPTVSSQFISALLQVAPGCHLPLELRFGQAVISEPYVQMTCSLMQRFGVPVQREGGDQARRYRVPAPATYRGRSYVIEPDGSNASYFLAAAAVMPGSRCTIVGLGRGSIQGDVGFAEILGRMGADVIYREQSITVEGPEQLDAVDVDLNTMPDMAQTLAVVALFARGATVIRNVGNLRVKETDRLAALKEELSKLGADVRVDGDDLHVRVAEPGRLRPATIATYDDHRMAMSFAVAGLAREGVTIVDPGCVNKTFPSFWEYLDLLRREPTAR